MEILLQVCLKSELNPYPEKLLVILLITPILFVFGLKIAPIPSFEVTVETQVE